jgi:hypothetical protein
MGKRFFPTSNTADNAYRLDSGTSMAAPNVTGTAALLLEHYRDLHDDEDPTSATLKGVLIHTASDAGNVGPDYQHGWGLVNAASAANFLTNSVAANPSNLLLELQYAGDDPFVEVRASGAEPLRATIVWTDPAPTTLPGVGLDDATSVLVNDLDLWITDANGTVFRPWTLNAANPNAPAVRTARNDRDNVEQVLIDAPVTAGIYRIHVGRDPMQPSFTQNFSLLISGVHQFSPAVVVRQPDSGAWRQQQGDLDVIFSEAVTGVTTSRLQLTSVPGPNPSVTSVTNLGNNTYRFHVTGLQSGTVTATLSGVTDLTGFAVVPATWDIGVFIGDVNSDGRVGNQDEIIIRNHLGQTDATWEDGDIDGDGSVTMADVVAWLGYFGTTYDLNMDQAVNRDDVAEFVRNIARQDNVVWQNGDVNYDRQHNLFDLVLIQANLDGGGEGFMGGGESMMGGGEGGGGEEMFGGESGGGGGGESFSGTPARFYFTTSGSTSGGGALGTSVPSVTLPSPGQTTDLYVWVKMEDYEALRGYAIDVSATTAGVVKAVESEIFRPYILDTQSQEEMDLRWVLERAAVLNRNGVGGTELVYDAAAANVIGGLDLRDSYDGTGWYTDPLYDAANDAFLTQRVRLEALPGSAGLSTDLEMRIGRLGMVIDNSTIFAPLPIRFGLGTTDVLNTDIFGTDGTTHATIAVAPGSPGAVVAMAPASRDSAGLGSWARISAPALRAAREIARLAPERSSASTSSDGMLTLRAVRRAAARDAAINEFTIARG